MEHGMAFPTHFHNFSIIRFWPIDPVYNRLLEPNVRSAGLLDIGREECGPDNGLRAFFHSQRSLVTRHVRVHVARVNMVDHEIILRSPLIEFPLLDPTHGRNGNFGNGIG
jgi:hypothetical protein